MDDNNDDLYTNLLRATDNLPDIVFQRYATVTATNNGKYTLKELDSELIHTDVPTIIGDVRVGDTVVVSFSDNSLHNPFIIGTTTPTNLDDLTILALGLGLFKIGDNGHLYVELPVNMDNFFEIDNNGDLIVDYNGASRDYTINSNGHLIYDRWDV